VNSTVSDINYPRTYKLNEITSISDIPCRNVQLSDLGYTCELCTKITDIKIEGNEIIGCPNLDMTCNGILVREGKIDCVSLAKSDKLICTQPTDTNGPKNDTGMFNLGSNSRIVLVVLATILGALLFIGIGYFILTKWVGIYLPNPFEQSSPVVYVEDETPLNAVDRDLDDDSSM